MTKADLVRIVLALSVAGFLSLATAQANADKALAGLDANGDGVVSREEALSAQESAFERIDENGDGAISKAEYEDNDRQDDAQVNARAKRRRAAARAAWFDNLDSDDSGNISLAEFQHAMTPYFDRLDRNGDGVVDSRELKAVAEAPRP